MSAPRPRAARAPFGAVAFIARHRVVLKLARDLPRAALAAVRQEHTPSGGHRNITTPYPRWVTPDVQEAAQALSISEARALLGRWLDDLI